MNIDQQLINLDIVLPEANMPAGNYLSYQLLGNVLYVSGQTTRVNGIPAFTGLLGDQLDLAQGQQAAEVCLLNVLCQVKHACGGDLGRVKAVAKLNVFVQSTASFKQQSKIADSASNLLVAIFAEKGKHARSAIGTSSLPGDSAVEIDAIFHLEDIAHA